MTVPTSNFCKSCHRPDDSLTRVELEPLHSFTKDLFLNSPFGTSDEYRGHECSAYLHWPDFPKDVYPELKHWVRQNYFSAFKQKCEMEGKPCLPVRLSGLDAKIEGDLKLQPFEITVQAGDGSAPKVVQVHPYGTKSDPWLAVEATEPHPSIKLSLEIKNNRIPLMLRSLVEFHNLEATVSKGLDWKVAPKRISVGNYGGLHAIFEPKETLLPTLMNLAMPFMVPVPPLGYDDPLFNGTFKKCVEGEIPDPDCVHETKLYYFDHQKPERDIALSQLFSLPPELQDSTTGLLPLSPDIEEFTLNILKVAARKAKLAKDPSMDLSQVLSLKKLLPYLVSGSKISVPIEKIGDLYLPGVVDLGESLGTLEATIGENNQLQLGFSDFSVRLDAMDYPHSPHGKRGPIHLHKGKLVPGEAYYDVKNRYFKPGIHATYDSQNEQWKLSSNVKALLDVSLPLLGRVRFNVPILFKTTWDKSTGFQETLFRLEDFIIQEPKQKNKRKKPPLLQGDFLLSENQAKDGFEIKLTGKSGKETQVEYEADLKIPTHEDGSYNYAALLQKLALESLLKLSDPKNGTFSIPLNLQSIPLPAIKKENGAIYQASAEVTHTTPSNTENKILENFILTFFPVKQSDGSWNLNLGLTVDRLDYQWAAYLKEEERTELKQILLNGIEGELDVKYSQLSRDLAEIMIPNLKIAANTEGSKQGIIRGPLSLEQKSPNPTKILWNSDQKELDLSNVRLDFGAEQLHVIPEKALARLNAPGDANPIACMGINGHIIGDRMHMEFPGAPHYLKAKGPLIIRGDQRDVWFCNKKGEQVGDPLLRYTEWRFDEIQRLDKNKEYALGFFNLFLNINLAAVTAKSPSESNTCPPDDTGLGCHEIRMNMPAKDEPWTLKGFIERQNEFLRDVLLSGIFAKTPPSTTDQSSHGGPQ